MQPATEEGVEITGCRFNYHQLVSGQIFYIIIDGAGRTSSHYIPVNVSKISQAIDQATSEDNLYELDSVTITSYNETGQFVQCRLFDPNVMIDGPALSDLSNQTVFECKCCLCFEWLYPVSTRRQRRRVDFRATLYQRQNDVVCLLGIILNIMFPGRNPWKSLNDSSYFFCIIVPSFLIGLLNVQSSYFVGDKINFNGVTFRTKFRREITLAVIRNEAIVKEISLITDTHIVWSDTTQEFIVNLTTSSVDILKHSFGNYSVMVKLPLNSRQKELNGGQDFTANTSSVAVESKGITLS